jgi:hypothetical protein
MTVSGISLVDANVRLAISVDGHIHHAAFAVGSALDVVTFDSDLTSFPGLSVRLLTK